MEMPIIRPSKVSYADEIDFAELLEELLKKRHNGYIRVTSGPDEGYILFKDGEQVASSFDRYSKSEAIEKIKLATEDSNTVIEVFDLRQSHVDYLIDINRPFLMEPDYDVYQIINELKSNKSEFEGSEIESADAQSEELGELEEPEDLAEPKKSDDLKELEKPEEPEDTLETAEESSEKLDTETDTEFAKESAKEATETKTAEITETTLETGLEPEETKSDSISVSQKESEVEKPEKEIETPHETSKESETNVQEPKTPEKGIKPDDNVSIVTETSKESSEFTPSQENDKAAVNEPASDNVNQEAKVEVGTSIPSASGSSKSSESDIKPETSSSQDIKPSKEVKKSGKVQDVQFSLTKSEKEDRSKLMERYGIKDVNEEDVEIFLDSYKGGYINDEDVEKIELTLMNRIKKSMLGIPKIKGAEVMVFLDNARTLSGTVNINADFESKGFFSRLIGESNNIDSLRRQIINIVEIELKRSFREYPEITNDFEINVEIG